MVTRVLNAPMEIEEAVNKLIETLLYAAWNATPRRIRITEVGDTNNYPLNITLSSLQRGKQDKYGNSQEACR